MLKMMLPFAGALLLASCYSESKYDTDVTQAACELTVKCYPDLYSDVAACVAEGVQGEETNSSCTFHRSAAKDCVAALDDADCPAKGENLTWPAVCTDVYTNCTPDTSSDTDTAAR
jgi:hypothetical protein